MKSVPAGKFHRVVPDNEKELHSYRERVAMASAGVQIITHGAVEVDLQFVMPRPDGHWGTGRNAGKLKASAPHWHAVTPDLDKLERATLDGMTSVCFHDDKQVAKVSKVKRYVREGEAPHCTVTFAVLAEEGVAV